MLPAAATNIIANATLQSVTSSVISHVQKATKQSSTQVIAVIHQDVVKFTLQQHHQQRQQQPLSPTLLQLLTLSLQPNVRFALTRTVSKENMVNAGTTLMLHA
jgi:hypothetical protein